MAMDVVSIQYSTDCTSRATRIRFALDIPVPPNKAEALKSMMDAGDWNGFKAQAKAFAPLAISGALDFLLSAAPQKAAAKAPAPAPAPATKP
jgi:hypothetical protein